MSLQVAFGKKTDKSGEYIRKWLPILKKFPDKYIYEPWRASLAEQKAAGCIIGKDYPKPIVDHDVISKKNIARMKEVGFLFCHLSGWNWGLHNRDMMEGTYWGNILNNHAYQSDFPPFRLMREKMPIKVMGRGIYQRRENKLLPRHPPNPKLGQGKLPERNARRIPRLAGLRSSWRRNNPSHLLSCGFSTTWKNVNFPTYQNHVIYFFLDVHRRCATATCLRKL